MATRRPQVPRSARSAGASSGSSASAAQGSTRASQTVPASRPAQSSGRAASGAGSRPSPAASRPSTARTSRPGISRTEQQPVPARAFSGRIVALALVLVTVTIMLAPTIRIFFSQRAEIQSIQADIAAKQTDQTNLKAEISRWQDPAFVQQQARDRINMVMPGETSYWVFGDVAGSSSTSGSAPTAAGSSPTDVPWTQSLWDAVRRAATQ